MTKKLLKKKFILELKEEDSSCTQVSEMEEDDITISTTHTTTDMVLDEEDEEDEEDLQTSSSSSANSSTSPPSHNTSSSRLIHSGSHAMEHQHPNKDFLLFRKMTAEAAAAVAAASATVPPIVPLPLRQSEFLLPSSAGSAASPPAFKAFHPRFSDEHWKALSSLYSNYYFPSPFLVGKLSPLLGGPSTTTFPRLEEDHRRLGSLSAFSSPFQPPLRSFHPSTPSSSSTPQTELQGGQPHVPLWSFDPIGRNKRSPSPSAKAAATEARMSSLMDPHKLFSSGRRHLGMDPASTSSSSQGVPSSPPAMKRYKRERLVLPSTCTLSKDQIIHMPIDQFNDYLARSNFSEEELSRLKDARRKGKNRVAARRSRDHRLQEVRCLKSRQERVKKDKILVFKEYESSIEDCKLWERIHELFSYHVNRFVGSTRSEDFKGGSSGSIHQATTALEVGKELRPSGGSSSSIVPNRAFNPPPALVLNSC